MSAPGWFRIEPIDAWVFRDARPFEAGAGHRLRTRTLPSPWTVQGALRAARLEQACRGSGRGPSDGGCPLCGDPSCGGWTEIGRGGPAPFRVGPILPVRSDGGGGTEVLYPAPADLLKQVVDDGAGGRNEDGRFALAVPLSIKGVVTDLRDLRTVAAPQGGRWSAGSEWLTPAGLEACLQGQVPAASDAVGSCSMWCQEIRPGVALGSGKTAVDGHLYFAEAMVPKSGVGIAVEIEGEIGERLDTPTEIRFGGEGHLARVWRMDPPAEFAGGPPPAERVKVYCLTPTIFRDGWRPPEIPGLTLVGAALERADLLGGWDLASRKPRPMRSIVPAGAVFFFERTSSEAERSAQALQGGRWGETTDLGFGLTLVGRW